MNETCVKLLKFKRIFKMRNRTVLLLLPVTPSCDFSLLKIAKHAQKILIIQTLKNYLSSAQISAHQQQHISAIRAHLQTM